MSAATLLSLSRLSPRRVGMSKAALGRTEQLLPLSLRAADPSWVRTAYALRAWLSGALRSVGAPFVAPLIELQLMARGHGMRGQDGRSQVVHTSAGRLAELILQATQ